MFNISSASVNTSLKFNFRKNCRGQEFWHFKFTFYGYCLEFNNDTTEQPNKVKSNDNLRTLNYNFIA